MARLLVFPSLGRSLASRACEAGASYEPRPRVPLTVTEACWLEARFPTEDRCEQARGLQSALRRLGAAQAAIELVLGEGLEALHSRFDLRELGHSNLDALCTGRLGFSAAHGRELRRLATHLPELPRLREAFLAGLVPRTRVRELLDIATVEDDAAWAQLARGLTTRELKKRVREVKAARRVAQDRAPADEGACARDEDEDLVRVSWLVSGAERATWGFGLALLRQLTGRRGPVWQLAELLAAETLSSCGPAEPDKESAVGCVRSESGGEAPPRPRRRSVSSSPALKQARKLERALRRARLTEPPALPKPPASSDFEACGNAGEVLDLLVALAQQLTAIESERARLLSWMQGRALYRELDHRSFHAWLERDLGLGPRDARRLVELQSRVALLPAVESAWQSGRLSTHQVWQLAEVAEPSTEVEWLDYAASVTPKLLDAAVEKLRVAERRARRPLPPWDVPLRELLLDWQEHFGRRRRRELRVVEGACAPAAAGCTAADEAAESSSPAGALPGPWRLGRCSFLAPPEVAKMWKEALAGVRAEVGTVLSDADCVRRMLEGLLETHVSDEVLERARRHRAIERDGWTCQMPHCRSMGPFHEHHRRFRSAGGSDEDWNLVTLCAPCHAMLHAGHVTILGRAPDELTFLLGTRREAWAGERRLEPVAARAAGAGGMA